VLLASVIAAGTLGYIVIEGWNAWDAFYMSVTTVATVGYREINPLSRAGQAFTVLLVVLGVGSALYAFSAITAVVLEGGWRQYLKERTYSRMLASVNDHYILCGFGRIGRTIAQEFHRQGVPFVVIDRDPEHVRVAEAKGYLAIEGDASQEETLRLAHIDRARALVAAVGTDAENVYAVLTARVLRPELFVIARAESDDSVGKLRRAGADRVISPYHIGAVQIAQTALRPAVVDFVEIATSSSNLELSMEQVKIGKGSALDGQSLADARVRERFGVVVVGIVPSGGDMEFNPAPDRKMTALDQLVVLGSQANLKDLERAAK